MTAQAAERIILDGRPRLLFADPLYRLAKRCRLDLGNPWSYSTANYRGYIGTWEILDGRLHLVHLCWDGMPEQPISAELRRKLLRAAACHDFPIHSHWFNGVARIALGRRLVYSHHGWSSWYERERVIHFREGNVVRDREVDTGAILGRHLRNRPGLADMWGLEERDPLGPMVWFDEDDAEDWVADWWPPDYVRPDRSM